MNRFRRFVQDYFEYCDSGFSSFESSLEVASNLLSGFLLIVVAIIVSFPFYLIGLIKGKKNKGVKRK